MKNKLMNSALLVNVLGLVIFYPIIALISEQAAIVLTGALVIGQLLYFVFTNGGSLYVTHYASKEEIEAIREAGFNKPHAEAHMSEEDLILSGQNGKDLVSFVSVNHKPVLKAKQGTYLDDVELVPLHFWVKPHDIFASSIRYTTWFAQSNCGYIGEVTVDRAQVNQLLAEGRVDTEENKLSAWLSKVIVAIAMIAYGSKYNLNAYVALYKQARYGSSYVQL